MRSASGFSIVVRRESSRLCIAAHSLNAVSPYSTISDVAYNESSFFPTQLLVKFESAVPRS